MCFKSVTTIEFDDLIAIDAVAQAVYFHYRCTRIPREHLARCPHAQTYWLRRKSFYRAMSLQIPNASPPTNAPPSYVFLQGRVIANGWAIKRRRHWPCRASFNQPYYDYLQPYPQFSKCKLEPSEDSVSYLLLRMSTAYPCLQIGIL